VTAADGLGGKLRTNSRRRLAALLGDHVIAHSLG
jgi:hypothetical protein